MRTGVHTNVAVRFGLRFLALSPWKQGLKVLRSCSSFSRWNGWTIGKTWDEKAFSFQVGPMNWTALIQLFLNIYKVLSNGCVTLDSDPTGADQIQIQSWLSHRRPPSSIFCIETSCNYRFAKLKNRFRDYEHRYAQIKSERANMLCYFTLSFNMGMVPNCFYWIAIDMDTDEKLLISWEARNSFKKFFGDVL